VNTLWNTTPLDDTFIETFFMSFVKIMVHAVWPTYCRRPLLANGVREKVCAHIRENAKTKNIRIDTINGHHDHMHCLTELNPELTIGDQIQLIKGESSHWVNNKTDLLRQHFSCAFD